MVARETSAVALTRRSATELARAIRAREVTSREVVEEHIELLRRTAPDINAIACERFDQARAEADAADARVAGAAPDDELPPLLGVPCTIKESIALEGMPNSGGLVARREHRASKSAPAAARLVAAGAIPLGVTNTSELCMWIESENRLYGPTRNAYDRRRIAGGSSGGEGAAVGVGGVPIGLGSDIGGSIRLPAFFNGVFGHKASPGLIPNSGQFPAPDGAAARMLTIGPITRRAEDLMPVLRAVAGPDGQDSDARDVELGDPADVDLEGLSVVLAEGTTVFPVSRELRDARDRAAAALSGLGADVRRHRLRSLRRAMEYYLATLQDGAGVDVPTLLGSATEAPLSVRRMAIQAAVRRGPHTRTTAILVIAEKLGGRMPPGRTRRAIEAGRSLSREVEGVLGDGVMLHPPFPRPAPRHGRTVGRPWVLSHAAVFNLLGLPVTQVPLGIGAEGLPLGVQVATARDADHRAIAVAQALERASAVGWRPVDPSPGGHRPSGVSSMPHTRPVGQGSPV